MDLIFQVRRIAQSYTDGTRSFRVSLFVKDDVAWYLRVAAREAFFGISESSSSVFDHTLSRMYPLTMDSTSAALLH